MLRAGRVGTDCCSRAQQCRSKIHMQPASNSQPRAAGIVCQAVTIVGGGRIGTALMDMGDSDKVLVRRGEDIKTEEGPIIVCTRNDVLDDVLQRTPQERRKDMVFIQNGMIQPWLDTNGLGGCTQVLVYFAVAKLGEAPVDGKTRTNPDGLTAVCGPQAQAFSQLLKAGGLSCQVLDAEAYKKNMLEKLVWICAFMLVGVHFEGCSVGDVAKKHTGPVELIILELSAAGEKKLGVKLDEGLVDRLCAYSESVAHFPTALKEFEFRNGWFLENCTKAEIAAGREDPCPTHTAWLQEAGFK